MRWVFKRYLLKILITILALYIAINTVRAFIQPVQPIKIIKQNQQIADSKYIISEQMIMSKLKSKSQIVSLEQQLDKKDTFVDENFFGKRATQLKLHGTYKLGLNTKDIEIKHIDSNIGMVCIKLGQPALISLDIPYNEIEFNKSQGFLRLAMDEKEEKNFYKAAKKNIEFELMKDKELMKIADSMNKDVVENILKLIPEIKSIVFE